MRDLAEGIPNTVIVAGAVLAALAVIWSKAVVPVRDWVRRFKAWMDRIEVGIGWVDTQMRPNGGSSLVDKVNATVVAVEELNTSVAMLLRHDAERDTPGHRYGPAQEEGNPDD